MTTPPNLFGVGVSVTSVIALHGKFARDKIAVRCLNPKGGGIRAEYSYGQFVQEMDTIAANVQKQFKNQRVATLLGNDTPRTLTTMFGCERGGACLVPLDPTLKPDLIKEILRDSNAKVVICSGRPKSLIADSMNGFRRIGLDFADNKWDSMESLLTPSSISTVNDDSANGMNSESNLMYSRGTAGAFKGIVQNHTNRLHWAWSNSIALRLQRNSRTLVTTPLHSNVTCLITLPTLFVGATLTAMEQFDPVETLEVIQREKITHIFMLPKQLKMCIDAGASSYDLSSLQMVLSTGSALTPGLKRKVLSHVSPNLFQLYWKPQGFASMLFPEEHAAKFRSAGKPLLGNDLRIVQTWDHCELTVPNEVGEICVRGPGMMLSYNNCPYDEIMKDIWIDPASGQKYFRTGDVGKVDEDGYLSVLGRKSDTIHATDSTVFPREIEEIILGHPAIEDVAVIGAHHDMWAETPVAIVIPRKGVSVNAKELEKWINERVSIFKHVWWVKVLAQDEDFPRNELGEIMKTELQKSLGVLW